MKGWHKESYRHYLASKGIKTNRYYRNKYRAPVFLSREIKKNAAAYVLPSNPNDIYINRMQNADAQSAADTISHEELHNILSAEVSEKASRQLDDIQWHSADHFDFDAGKKKYISAKVGKVMKGETSVSSLYDKFHDLSGKFLEEAIPMKDDDFMDEYKELYEEYEDLVEENEDAYNKHRNALNAYVNFFSSTDAIKSQEKVLNNIREEEIDFKPIAHSYWEQMHKLHNKLGDLKEKYNVPEEGEGVIEVIKKDFPGGHGVRVERR